MILLRILNVKDSVGLVRSHSQPNVICSNLPVVQAPRPRLSHGVKGGPAAAFRLTVQLIRHEMQQAS